MVEVATCIKVKPTAGKAPLQTVAEVCSLDGHCNLLTLLYNENLVACISIL